LLFNDGVLETVIVPELATAKFIDAPHEDSAEKSVG
jgi:hypothetical protein